MPAGDIYQLSVDQTLQGVAMTNVHYFKQESADNGDMGQACIDAYQADVQVAQLACQSSALTLDQYRAVRVHPGPSQPVVETIGAAGTRAGDACAASQPALLSFYDIATGVVRSARTFLSGIVETDISVGLIEGALRTLLETFGALLEANISSPGGDDFRKQIWSVATSTARDVIKCRIRQQLRKLRSRRE